MAKELGLRKARHKGGVDKKKFMKALKLGVQQMSSGKHTDMAAPAGKHNPVTAKSTNRW